jgi:hypothetical protein
VSAAEFSGPDPLIALGFGLSVFPLPPGGRRPNVGWQQRCMSDAATVIRSWRTGDNVGVGCRASGVVVLDLDQRGADGIAAFADVCGAHGQPWPVTLTVRTPSQGLHVYFRAPVDRVVLNTSGGLTKLGPGVDVRAPGRTTGGFVVGPGSVVDGAVYAVDVRAAPIPLPGWITELIAEPVRLSEGTGMLEGSPAHVRQDPDGGQG